MTVTSTRRDIVATWPKSRTLDSYLEELQQARKLGFFINFRVPNLPRWPQHVAMPRCYMVHDGAIRGYNHIVDATWYDEETVARVKNDSWAGFWPAGWYLVRTPEWNPVEPIPMRGFQGWRWYDGV